MNCLRTADIQALVDGEATDPVRRHAASCADCSRRVRERERLTASLLGDVSREIELPPAAVHRMSSALAGSQHGATRLRPAAAPRRHRAFWSASLAAAATLAAIFLVAPMFKGPSTVSASEILAASASRLQSAATGIEVREYELIVDGVPKEMMPDHANGSYRVWQAIDHDVPGRFRFASFDANGQPVSSIAQDPAQGRRVTMMTMEGQAFRFETSLPAAMPLSLPELERLHMEATIAMMQASGGQLLQVVDTPEGQQYRIEVDQQGHATSSPVWDLTRARVVVDARDYRVMEFSVTGTVLKQPYSLSYRLLQRTQGASLTAEAFEVPKQAGEIAFTGEGSAVPTRDAIVLAFRELARLKQPQ